MEVNLKLPDGGSQIGNLSEVLYVPSLSYNLLSVAKVTEAGKNVQFSEMQEKIFDDQGELVAKLETSNTSLQATQINSASHQSKENLWHRRFGHLGERGLSTLKKDGLVRGFEYNTSKSIDFCESCVGGKIHRNPFPNSNHERAAEPLELVHSDVCGKMGSPSLSQAEYFVTFIDDKTHYVWIYVMRHKHEVFQKFLEWKSLVEKSSRGREPGGAGGEPPTF